MRKKGIIFCTSILLFWGFLLFGVNEEARENEKILSTAIKTEDELNLMKEGREASEELPGAFVRFCEKELPYDGNYGFYYISQSMNTEQFEGQLKTLDHQTEVYFYEDSYWKDKKSAVREGHPFRFIVFGDRWYTEDEIVFSGLPIISITGDLVESEQKSVSNNSRIVVWNPSDAIAGGMYTIKESYCTYYERGASSRQFDKKSFGIRLFDEKGDSQSKSFLGMRDDNKWILNALYSDTSKIREKLALDIWSEISPNLSGSRMEYAEVFVNGFYRGLYGLMEPIDRKQLSLKEGDYLYKCGSLEGINKEYYVPLSDCMETEDIEVEYPKEPQPDIWAPMQYYTEFITEGNITENSVKLDEENVVNYWLFAQFLSASDNIDKNFFIAASEDGNGLLLQKIPWDLNYSFGDAWSDETTNMTKFGVFDIDTIYSLQDYQNLYQSRPDEISGLTKSLWNSMRDGVIQQERLCEAADEYMTMLAESGAFARESLRWPEAENNTDISSIKEYIGERIAFLDSVIADGSNYGD